MVHADCLLAGFGNPGRPPVSVGVMGLVLFTLFGVTGPALGESSKNAGKAEEVDTEHMFGFITGTDIGQVGDKELESETTGRLGKRTGSYTALSHTLALEYTPWRTFDCKWAPSRVFMTYPAYQTWTICVGENSKASPSK